MSFGVDENCSRAPSPEARKREVSEAEENDDANAIARGLDSIAKAINRATDVLAKCLGSKRSGENTFAALEEMNLNQIS